jgi:hypothetical protein
MDVFRLRPLLASDAAAAAELIRTAFADQGANTDPPSSALRETAAIVADKLANGGGVGGEREGVLIGVVLWTLKTMRSTSGGSRWRRRGEGAASPAD